MFEIFNMITFEIPHTLQDLVGLTVVVVHRRRWLRAFTEIREKLLPLQFLFN